MLTNDGKKTREEFINEHIDAIKKQILKKELPEHWEGLELKQYIADVFQGDLKSYFRPKRLREYRNDVLVNNL
jgi:hypothetical protein